MNTLLTENYLTAAIEEWVVSNFKKIIPEGVKQQFNEWRAAWHGTYKDAENKELGDNHISEEVEKVGWGVEEAQQAHKADASKSTYNLIFFFVLLSRDFSKIRSWDQLRYGMDIALLQYLRRPRDGSQTTYRHRIRLFHSKVQLTRHARSRNPARISVRNPQELHLHTSSAHGCRYTQGRQGVAIVGLANRQTEAQDAQGFQGFLTELLGLGTCGWTRSSSLITITTKTEWRA